jgi:DNA-binding response OmpR family regulator
VVSRTSILEHCWDVNYDGFSNVVDVYVGYLRKKLEQPFGRPLIRTVRGVGYLLEPSDSDGDRSSQARAAAEAEAAAETGGR